MISRSTSVRLTPRSEGFRDALKVVVAVHFDWADAITAAREMYNASCEEVICLIVDS